MFWKKKAVPEAKPADPARRFEMAKEATRRAVFLNTAARMPQGDHLKQGLETVFRACRMAALAAGAAVGQSEAEVDAAISAKCDEDVVTLKNGSVEDIREFSRESREIVNVFLASLDDKTLASAAQD